MGKYCIILFMSVLACVSPGELDPHELEVWEATIQCFEDNGLFNDNPFPPEIRVLKPGVIPCGIPNANACTKVKDSSIPGLLEIEIQIKPENVGNDRILVHEFKHVYLQQATGDLDSDHITKWYAPDSPCPDTLFMDMQ